MKICSNLSKSKDKSSRLQSQRIDSIPKTIGLLKSVAHETEGTTTFLIPLSILRASRDKRIAEDPELIKQLLRLSPRKLEKFS